MARAIFMFMHGDMAVDPSPEKAAGGMEAVDVEAGEYDAIYDIGLVYEPIVENYRVRLIPTETRDYEDLVRRLTDFGSRAGLVLPDEGPDFPVAVARRVAAWDWEHRWPKRPKWLSRRIHGSQPPQFDRP
jgi:hypothetical protein